MTPQERAAQRTASPVQQQRAASPVQRVAQQRTASSQQHAAQQRAAQLQAQQRAAQQRTAQQRAGQQRAAQQRTAQQLGAASPTRATAARSGTDDLARLMQRNTVDVSAAAARRRSPVIGKIALVLAVVCAAVDGSAFAMFMGGAQQFAFGVCFVVVFLTFIAAVLGFVAAVGSLGRWYGVVGVVIAFFANPVVLIVLVVFVAPEVLNTMAS